MRHICNLVWLGGTFAVLLTNVLSGELSAKQIRLEVGLSHPTMLIKDGKGENHLRVGLTGFELPNEKVRLPVNVAIVIDKSGSMQGEKISQARRAAVQAVDRLNDNDIVSIVAYDSEVGVVLPATKASDRETIKRRIESIQAGGNTALHAGMTQGAAEIRKFLKNECVNRIILLSDGLANVGPSSPDDLEQLGQSLIKENITVSTMGLGLGYNEDLMSRLALAASGNHVFIEDAENLVQVFQREFDDVLSVVAQQLQIRIRLAEGIRPVKVLNFPADIGGQGVVMTLGQLYAKQERYFVLEMEIPLGRSGESASVGEVSVEYFNTESKTTDKLTSSIEVLFTDSPEAQEKAIDKKALSDCVIQIANERNREATRLRDAGQVAEAERLLRGNAAFLIDNYQRLGNSDLMRRSALNEKQAGQLKGNWPESRKQMVEAQYGDAVQQSFGGDGKKKP